MAADQTLVEGAYRAARAGVEADLAGLKAKTDIISGITKGVTDVIGAVQAEEQKYDEYVQKVIDNAGGMSNEQTSKIYDKLEEGKKGFIWGSKKDKALAIRDLTKKASYYKEWESVRLDVADNSDSKNNEGFSSSFSKEDRLSILSAEVVEKTCDEGVENCHDKGEPGIVLNGEWKSIPAVKTLIEKNKIDLEFKNNINAFADDILNRSKNIPEGQVSKVPEGEIKRKISGLLETSKTTGNVKSVAKDAMFGKTSWYEDGVEKIVSGNYLDLGVTEEQLKAADTNGVDGIQDDEAMTILDAIMENEDTLLSELNEYYFGFINQNWIWGEEGQAESEEGYEPRTGKYKKTPQDIDVDEDPEWRSTLDAKIQQRIQEIENDPDLTDKEKSDMIVKVNELIVNL